MSIKKSLISHFLTAFYRGGWYFSSRESNSARSRIISTSRFEMNCVWITAVYKRWTKKIVTPTYHVIYNSSQCLLWNLTKVLLTLLKLVFNITTCKKYYDGIATTDRDLRRCQIHKTLSELKEVQQEISKKCTHAFDFKGAIKSGGTFDKDANCSPRSLESGNFVPYCFS